MIKEDKNMEKIVSKVGKRNKEEGNKNKKESADKFPSTNSTKENQKADEDNKLKTC